jgi:hypothetical protein
MESGKKIPCPHCESINVVSLEEIYENGTTVSTVSGFAVGAQGIYGAMIGSGTSHSLTALRAAPPAKKQYGLSGALFLLFLAACVFSLCKWISDHNTPWDRVDESQDATIFFMTLAVSIACSFSVISTALWNSEKWPEKFMVWKLTWICKSCGRTFVRRSVKP